MRFSLIIVLITIGLGDSKPAIHCQNKHHASHEQLLFSRDLLPEQNLYDILHYALDVSINPDNRVISGSVVITLQAKADGIIKDDLNDVYLIFTMPNADPDSRIIKKMIDGFVSSHKQRSISFSSMGHLNYVSTLQFVDGVVGNSSSGLSEAPIFKIGTINIGDRQLGRLKTKSIIDCEPTDVL